MTKLEKKMTPLVQDWIPSKRIDGNLELWGQGCKSSFRRTEKGGKLNTFWEEEIAEILPKIMTTTGKIRLDDIQLLFEEYLLV